MNGFEISIVTENISDPGGSRCGIAEFLGSGAHPVIVDRVTLSFHGDHHDRWNHLNPLLLEHFFTSTFFGVEARANRGPPLRQLVQPRQRSLHTLNAILHLQCSANASMCPECICLHWNPETLQAPNTTYTLPTKKDCRPPEIVNPPS